MNAIYYLAYLTLHNEIQFRDNLKDTIQWIGRKMESFLDDNFITTKPKKTISTNTSKLKKHKQILYLFSDDDLKDQKINEILKLIIYSIAANIEYITLYTPKGIILLNIFLMDN